MNGRHTEGVAGFCKYPIVTKALRPQSNEGRAVQRCIPIHCTGYNENVRQSGNLETGGSSSEALHHGYSGTADLSVKHGRVSSSVDVGVFS